MDSVKKTCKNDRFSTDNTIRNRVGFSKEVNINGRKTESRKGGSMIKVSLERRFIEGRLLRALEGLRSAVKDFHSADMEYQEALISWGNEKVTLISEVKERVDAAEWNMKKAREEYETVLERAYMQYLGRP